MLNALRRWWKIAFPVGVLLSAATAGLVYWSFEPQYEAAALLEIKEDAPYIAFEPREAGVSKAYFRTQIEIIKSRWIMGRTVASGAMKDLPEIRKKGDPIEWLRRKVTVVSPNDSDVFEIKYTSADPESAALVVNEVTRQYLESQSDEESKRMERIVKTLEHELADRREGVKALRQQVEKLSSTSLVASEEHGTRGDEREERPIIKDPISDWQSRLVAVQVERTMLTARIHALEDEIHNEEAANKSKPAAGQPKNSAAPPAKKTPRILTPAEIENRDMLVEQLLDNAPELKQLDDKLLLQQLALEKLEKQLKQGKKDRFYVRAEEEIKFMEKAIEELKKRLRPRIEKEVELTLLSRRSEHPVGPQSDVAILEHRKEELRQLYLESKGMEKAEDELRIAYVNQFNKYLKERQQSSNDSLTLKFKRDELSEAQAVLARISERLVSLQTEQSALPRDLA